MVNTPSKELFAKARRAIFQIHLARRDRDPATFDLDALAAAAEGFSGAEIEQAIVASLYVAFADKRQVATDDGGIQSGMGYAMYNYIPVEAHFLALWKSATGEDIFGKDTSLHYFPVWALYTITPNGEAPPICDIGVLPNRVLTAERLEGNTRVGGNALRLYCSLIANRYRDGRAAWLMPDAKPSPDSAENYGYWEKYLDYIIGSGVGGSAQTVPASYRNKIGYATYVQFMLDHGRDLKPAGIRYVPLSRHSPDCPWHLEETAGGTFRFPPRTQPIPYKRSHLLP